MDIQELRGKTDDELKALLIEQKKEQFNLRFQQASGELENTSRMRTVRKTIARIYTLHNDKQAKEGPKAAPKKEAKKAVSKVDSVAEDSKSSDSKTKSKKNKDKDA